jgi:type VI secretion system secreted protein Hcp
VVRKAGEKPVEYLKIKMDGVFVTSLSTGGSGGEDRLIENVTLNFSKVSLDYVPQSIKAQPERPSRCHGILLRTKTVSEALGSKGAEVG